MVFIKKVRSRNKTYYYLVHSYREGEEIFQETIRRLTLKEANDPNFIEKFIEMHPEYQKTGVKAIILAAGKSLRLFPHSQNVPKGLIPVGGKPILQYIVENLKSNGINDIMIVTGFQDEKIRNLLGKKIKYIYNPFFNISNILSSAWFASQEMNSSLFILYGDILFNKTIITDLLNDERDFVITISSSRINHEAEKVITDDDTLVEISRNIPSNEAIYEFAGIAKFSKAGAIILGETLEEMAREEGFLDFFFTASLERLMLKGYRINTFQIPPDHWIDIDYPKDLQRAINEILPNITNSSQKGEKR